MEFISAAKQVGFVAEVIAALVEQFESAADLARAQQVSKSWHYEVARSRLCQERLFRVPAAEKELIEVVHTDDNEMSPWYVLSRTLATIERKPQDQVVVAFHPLIQGLPIDHCAGGVIDIDRLLTLSEGTWQDHYIAQPPVRQLLFTVQYIFDDGPYLREPKTIANQTTIDDGDPINFRRILEELKATCRVSEPDFWTWLPEAYDNERKIALDDYIASYGFPRPILGSSKTTFVPFPW
ncbi:hypothetical protein Slin15195_G085950 [Septoria linicola]|uniref:Uncharacterized protein n=1 Tax=Septoria linicola TaxID=215465 RepID=A0A9Q9EKY4_9PEZI|nr:hypothetical protein Slin14017_G088540 [Septoria linicola]USW55276.1 hypothetical protein Slin15195_G085950 [Septoria linicola]